MIHAYDKSYLAAAQKNLARMLDYLVNDLHHPLETAWQWFLTSELSARFEQGDCSVLVGMSSVFRQDTLCIYLIFRLQIFLRRQTHILQLLFPRNMVSCYFLRFRVAHNRSYL